MNRRHSTWRSIALTLKWLTTTDAKRTPHPTATIGFTYPFFHALFVFSFLPDGWMVVRFVSEIWDHWPFSETSLPPLFSIYFFFLHILCMLIYKSVLYISMQWMFCLFSSNFKKKTIASRLYSFTNYLFIYAHLSWAHGFVIMQKAIKVNRYWFNKNNKKTWKQKETKKNKNKFTLGNHPVVSSSHVHQNGSRLVLNSRQASELKQFVPIYSGLLTMTNFCPITDYDWLFKLTHLVSAEQTQHRIRK